MRVGILTTSYPRDEDDPAGAFVAGFTRWLSARAEVEVLCADGARPLFYRGGAPLAIAQGRWREAVGFSARLLAAAIARASRWDAVVSHWLVPSALAARMACGKLPHLAVAHGSDVRLLSRLPGGRSVMRQIAASADLVYVASQLRVDGAPGRVVPMGVEVAAFTGGDREKTRRALDCRGFTILFLGRLIQQKGVDRAIDALPDGAELLVAGAGPLRGELEARARGKRVRFLGEVRGAAKRDLLAAADVMVVPSREDGAPTVIMEGLAAGLPIVGGLAELVGDAGFANLAALSRLRDDPDLLRELSKRAKARAWNYDWAAIGPQLATNLRLPNANANANANVMPNGNVRVTRM